MFHTVLLVLMLVQGLFLLLALFYIAFSLHFEDRVVGTNLVGTIVINFIVLLSAYMGEGFGMDIALVYAFLSFLAVVVLCRLLAVRQVEHTIDRTERAAQATREAGERQRQADERARLREEREAESASLRRQYEALRSGRKGGEGI